MRTFLPKNLTRNYFSAKQGFAFCQEGQLPEIFREFIIVVYPLFIIVVYPLLDETFLIIHNTVIFDKELGN